MSKQKQKELLPLMIAKTVLAIVVITGLGTIIFGGGVVIMKYYGNEASNRIIKTVDQEKENYYDVLEKKCNGSSCCLSSLKFMKENNYKEAGKDYKCPDGFKASGLRCESSLSWCEPMEEDCKKHGETLDYTAPGDDMSVQCCNGLKHRIQKKYFDENCVNLYEKYGYGGYAGICINCGDNICDTEFENKCNCPEDCGDNALLNCCNLECEKYRYSSCPEGCTKACVGSCPLCRDCDGEGSCYCSEDCEKEIDERFYCEEDNDCLATCTSPGCYNKNWYETVMGGDCETVIIHSCECVNNKCQRIEEQSDTSDWQTYRNEEFGFEMKYPKGWKINETKNQEENNRIVINMNLQSFLLIVDNNPNNLDLRTWYNEEHSGGIGVSFESAVKKEEISIGENSAIILIIDAEGTYKENILMSNKKSNTIACFKKSFTLWTNYIDSWEDLDDEDKRDIAIEKIRNLSDYNTFNQILSTFKFIES